MYEERTEYSRLRRDEMRGTYEDTDVGRETLLPYRQIFVIPPRRAPCCSREQVWLFTAIAFFLAAGGAVTYLMVIVLLESLDVNKNSTAL